MWVIATPWGYAIQFYPYQGAGTSYNVLGLVGLVVSNLIFCLLHQDGSMYHIVFDNFFTSLCLLQHLSENGFAGTGTLQDERCMKAPLTEVNKMERLPRGSFDVMLDTKSNTSVSHWKDNKEVTVASKSVGARPLARATRYNPAKCCKTEIDQSRMIHVYNKGMEELDLLDQNVMCYMTNICSKKWWWQIFRFSLLFQSTMPFSNIKRRVVLQVSSLLSIILGFDTQLQLYICYRLHTQRLQNVSLSPGRPVKYNQTSGSMGKIIGLPKEHNADVLLAMEQHCIFAKGAM